MRTIIDTINTTVNNTIITHNNITILPINLDNQPDNQDHNIIGEQEQIFL